MRNEPPDLQHSLPWLWRTLWETSATSAQWDSGEDTAKHQRGG